MISTDSPASAGSFSALALRCWTLQPCAVRALHLAVRVPLSIKMPFTVAQSLGIATMHHRGRPWAIPYDVREPAIVAVRSDLSNLFLLSPIYLTVDRAAMSYFTQAAALFRRALCPR